MHMTNAIANYALVPGALLDILYGHLSNLAFNLEIDPKSLITFGLTALTASQILQRIPDQYQVRIPFLATILNDQEASLVLTANAIGVVFAKCVTDSLSKNPLSWTQAAIIETTRVLTKIMHFGLIAAFQDERIYTD